ncbi:hypothetical protein H0H93_009225 [Arthromyces matolae]|nr:hypothetical protein H0H93_009225 [Arthromyces matolae]
MLLASGKSSSTLTNQMVSATFHHLLTTIRTEQDPSFLASLYKCLNDSLRVIGGPSLLPKEFGEGIVEVTKFQLGVIAERRRARAERINRAAGGGGGGGGGAGGAIGAGAGGMELDKEEMALMEEVEDFVLEDMGKMLSVLDGSHPLLIAVSGVRDLGCNVWDSEEEEEE